MSPYELRYRDPSVKQPHNVNTNEFIETHLKRKSVRYFDPDRKIDPEQLKYLICAAQAAPTSSGTGSWSVIALSTTEEKEAFKNSFGHRLFESDSVNAAAFNTCSVFLLWILDNYKLEYSINQVANKNVNPDIYKILPQRIPPLTPSLSDVDIDRNPVFDAEQHIKILDQNYYTLRALGDTFIAAQTFTMCAESLGLTTVYMGAACHGELSCFKETLNMPQRTYPAVGLCVGYENPAGTDNNGCRRTPEFMEWFREDPSRNIKPVQPIDAVLHWGSYNCEKVHDSLNKYNDIYWKYTNSVNRDRPESDYMIARVVCRLRKCINVVYRMIRMGNRFD